MLQKYHSSLALDAGTSAGDVAPQYTLSIGVAQYVEGGTPTGLVHRTDVAAYQAKRAGKNRVVGADLVVPGGAGGP
jgi:diguanylate cyclase